MLNLKEIYQKGKTRADKKLEKDKKQNIKKFYKKATKALKFTLKEGKTVCFLWASSWRWRNIGLEKTKEVAEAVGKLIHSEYPEVSYTVEKANCPVYDAEIGCIDRDLIRLILTYNPNEDGTDNTPSDHRPTE